MPLDDYLAPALERALAVSAVRKQDSQRAEAQNYQRAQVEREFALQDAAKRDAMKDRAADNALAEQRFRQQQAQAAAAAAAAADDRKYSRERDLTKDEREARRDAIEAEYKKAQTQRALREPRGKAVVGADPEEVGQYLADLEAGSINLSTVPKGPIRTAVQNARAQKQASGEGGNILTADQRKSAEAISKAEPALAMLSKLSERINTSTTGPGAKLGGLFKQGMAAGGMDADVDQYQKTLKGTIPFMARALGHSGVLTESDANRTEELFPALGDNAELAKRKRTALAAILADAKLAATGKPVRQRSLDEYLGAGSAEPSAGPKYVEGKVYQNKSGQRARFVNGKMEPL